MPLADNAPPKPIKSCLPKIKDVFPHLHFKCMRTHAFYFDDFLGSFRYLQIKKCIHGQELNATVPDPDRTPFFLDLDRI